MSDIDWGSDEPIEPDSDDENGESSISVEVRNILSELGYDSVDGVILDFSHVDPSAIQGARFDNLNDAILYLYDAGILSFFGVVFIPGEERYGVVPDYPTETDADEIVF